MYIFTQTHKDHEHLAVARAFKKETLTKTLSLVISTPEIDIEEEDCFLVVA